MKNLDKSLLYHMPSGAVHHPNRLIHKDGTIMWKHALLYSNVPSMPKEVAHEAHIIKTAQRLEELNSWVSLDGEPWECLLPTAWYVPDIDFLSQGISLFFKHATHDAEYVYNTLRHHTHDHEKLELCNHVLYFQRC